MKIQISERMKQILDTKELEVMEVIIEEAEDWISVVNTLEDGEALDALGVDDQEAVEGAHDYATAESRKYDELEADLKNSAEEMNPKHFINDLHILMLEAKADAIKINYTDTITEALAELSAFDEFKFLAATSSYILEMQVNTGTDGIAGMSHSEKASYYSAFVEIEKFRFCDEVEGA